MSLFLSGMYQIKRFTKQGIEFIIKNLKKKKIVIAGRNASGKTSLSYYWAKKMTPLIYQQTLYNEKLSSKIENKYVDIKDCRNHDKKTSNYSVERDAVKWGDVILYLFDLEKIYSNFFQEKEGCSYYYRELFEDEVKFFSNKLCKRYKKPLILIGTHLDKIKGFDYKKNLKNNLNLMEIVKKEYSFQKISTLDINASIIPVALVEQYIEESTSIIWEEVKKYI